MVKNPKPHGEKANPNKDKNKALKTQLEDANTVAKLKDFLKEYTELK
jgi:hypothetical protein